MAFDMADEADTAGIFFKLWVVQTLSWREIIGP